MKIKGKITDVRSRRKLLKKDEWTGDKDVTVIHKVVIEVSEEWTDEIGKLTALAGEDDLIEILTREEYENFNAGGERPVATKAT